MLYVLIVRYHYVLSKFCVRFKPSPSHEVLPPIESNAISSPLPTLIQRLGLDPNIKFHAQCFQDLTFFPGTVLWVTLPIQVSVILGIIWKLMVLKFSFGMIPLATELGAKRELARVHPSHLSMCNHFPIPPETSATTKGQLLGRISAGSFK